MKQVLRWYRVPVTITEHRRMANIQAYSKTEARRLAREAEWENLDDSDDVRHKIVGPVEEDEEVREDHRTYRWRRR